MLETRTVIIELTWDDLLNFGIEYEAIWQLMADRIAEELELPETSELFVTDYGFVGVVDPGAVEVEVTVEINDYEEDDALYQITPKGKLVLTLMRHLTIDIDLAQKMANEIYPDDGEVVAS